MKITPQFITQLIRKNEKNKAEIDDLNEKFKDLDRRVKALEKDSEPEIPEES